MKIQGPRGVQKAKAVKRTSAQLTGASSTSVGGVHDTVSIVGIPEAEFTPKVKEAVTTLLAEVDRLARELGEMKQRFEDLETFADQDDLLPILNRRAFVRELSRIKSFGERYELKASLLYIDLNNFKTINDTYGHAAGDAVLCALATTLVKNLRESDVIGRLGGDEFGIVLPNADAQAAQNKATSLAKSIQAMKVPFEGRKLEISAAIGSCVLSKDVAIEEALAAADRDMYDKKGGSKAT
jgi:diguanylate cyclase (GGDEF)-like protein